MTADALIRSVDDRALERILATYGELPRARSAVRAIRRAASATQPLTTGALREALAPIYPGPRRPRRLAQAFQALRVVVNHEMEELEALLDQAGRRLRPKGRLCVIAYHSLEDRIVKNALRPPRPLDAWEELADTPWTPLARKPIRPTDSEIAMNPRAASARLRVAERKENRR
jgi:16S rRNA (cytosine1402-N4)-methyltransferase